MHHTRRAALLWVATLYAMTSVAPASAQTPAKSDVLDARERSAVVDQIARLLNDNYVFPDVAAKSGQHIKARLAAGAFDSVTDATTFANRLTTELQSINHDKHMRVRVRPPADAMMQRDDPETAMAQQLREMQSANYGFVRVEHLDGNVGYLDLRFFASQNVARETAIAAMRLLSNSDAIVIDLRKNGGGNPDMVQLLCSYFFGTRTHLNSLYWRRDNRTQEFWTLDELPGRRMPNVPLFVLTSNRTFSGAEEFTYNMQTRKRATIIGETTGGGANPGGMMPVNDRFGIFIPTGRAINPVTGTNWEGVGVKPDVAVDASVALDTALVRARAAARTYRAAEDAIASAGRAELKRGVAAASALLQKGQIAEGENALSEALRKGMTAGVQDENSINAMGYRYLQAGDKPLAIGIFKFNVSAFPKSANTYDSLGEAYMANGDRELAIRNYRKSLELDASNTNAVEMLKKLESR